MTGPDPIVAGAITDAVAAEDLTIHRSTQPRRTSRRCGARDRRWVEIGKGNMVRLERQRLHAFRAVGSFLTEREPAN